MNDPFPMIESRKAIDLSPKSQVVGEFLEWLEAEGYTICAWKRNDWYNIDELVEAGTSTNRLIAEFFGIDRDRVELERGLLLDVLREDKTPDEARNILSEKYGPLEEEIPHAVDHN